MTTGTKRGVLQDDVSCEELNDKAIDGHEVENINETEKERNVQQRKVFEYDAEQKSDKKLKVQAILPMVIDTDSEEEVQVAKPKMSKEEKKQEQTRLARVQIGVGGERIRRRGRRREGVGERS